MKNNRRTKIIATLGPAADRPGVLEGIIKAGADVVRMNFSHGSLADHEARFKAVREIAAQCQREVSILADLQGPKIRIAKFQAGKITLKVGQPFTLDPALDDAAGDETQVGIHYKELCNDVSNGDILLLDDGRLELTVRSVADNKIHCEVRVGGTLSNNKGINRLGGGISAKALTDKDRADIKSAVALGADFIAVSFPRTADDIKLARLLIEAEGGDQGIVAKIERAEAVVAIDEIIAASDAVMVARGDLGVEIGDAELPGVQKHIIRRARDLNKAVITATQMMESMIHNLLPTRAEVFDVANAVLDGTDAVMLSAETATGDHPEKVIEAMARVCIGAEKEPRAKTSRHRIDQTFARCDEAIAMSAMYIANHLDIKAIVALTESGSTPLWMSRIRSGIPIYALTRHQHTRRMVTLYRGVYPLAFDITEQTRESVNKEAIETLKAYGAVQDGDRIILTKGDLVGINGGTNAIKIMEVGKVF